MIIKAPDPFSPFCPFNIMKQAGPRLCNRQLTEPLNCALVSRCPGRHLCLERMMHLVDALEAADTATVQRITTEPIARG